MRVRWSMIAVVTLSMGVAGFSSVPNNECPKWLAESGKKDDDKDDEDEICVVSSDLQLGDDAKQLAGSGKKDDEKKRLAVTPLSSETQATDEFQGSGRKERRRRGPVGKV